MRGSGTSILIPLLALLGCVAVYDDDAPPGLDEVPSVDRDGQDGDDDVLVYERQLRWWQAPTLQRVRLFRRADDSYLLLRERSIGGPVYAFAEASLTEAGTARLDAAMASADPSRDEPAPGNYACTYQDVLPAIVYVEGGEDVEAVEYLPLCPPEGLVDLVGFYEDVVELLLDCPLEPSWFVGDLPIAESTCEAVP